MFEAKESQMMLQWMKMDSNEFKWAKQVGLESLFNMKWKMPKEDMLWDFYKLGKQHRMEEFKANMWSRNFHWLGTYSWTTWNFQGRSSRCCKCNFWGSQNHLEKDCRSTCFCWKWTMECSKHERGISCKICSYFAKKN